MSIIVDFSLLTCFCPFLNAVLPLLPEDYCTFAKKKSNN